MHREMGRVTRMRMQERKVRMRAQQSGESGAAEIKNRSKDEIEQ